MEGDSTNGGLLKDINIISPSKMYNIIVSDHNSMKMKYS